MSLLHPRETADTSGLPGLALSFRAFRLPAPYVHFRRGKCNTGASRSASRCHLVRDLSIRAVVSNGHRSPPSLLHLNVILAKVGRPGGGLWCDQVVVRQIPFGVGAYSEIFKVSSHVAKSWTASGFR